MIDHLVYAVPDLAEACDRLEREFGVRPSPGGKHVGRGTNNALLDLGDGRYLEVIAPDPDQPRPEGPRPFGIDDLRGPRLVTWAMKAPDVDERVERARERGFDPGPVLSMSRRRPDGIELSWRLTRRDPATDGLVPFLIDWGSSPHPSVTAAKGCRLVSFTGEHPRPDEVRRALSALGIDLTIRVGATARLVASIDTPRGVVELS